MQPWEIKRFLELLVGDQAFRSELCCDPKGAIDRRGLGVDPERLRFAWDPAFDEEQDPAAADPSVAAYLSWKQADEERIGRWFGTLKEETPEPFRSWRERQANRYASQAIDGSLRRDRLLPFAIELAKGCSIGCEYCGVAAERLQSVARFERNDNGTVFAQVLRVLREFVGPGAATGFLYWATEPFDNPDYEKYHAVFEREMGIPPQTTTAGWARNPKRTRAFLDNRRQGSGIWDRFSVNTVEELHQLMDWYSAEELAHVELILQNPGSVRPKASAGRGEEADPEALPSSIACLTGFLINLVDRSVQLISPCTDFENWPLGYVVHKQSNFSNGVGEFERFLSDCDAQIFGSDLGHDYRPCLRSELESVEESETGSVAVQAPFARFVFKAVERDLLHEIDGERTVGELVATLSAMHHPAYVQRALQGLHRLGLFEHLPLPQGNAARPHAGTTPPKAGELQVLQTGEGVP